MLGFHWRDRVKGCEGVHDDLFVRALYVSHEAEEVLFLSFDLCFLSREAADRYKGALGRTLDLLPRQIVMNYTHTHGGPDTGWWGYGHYTEPDPLYLKTLEQAILDTAAAARANACPVTLETGVGRTTLPRSRRKLNAVGIAEWAPDPQGEIYAPLPVCLFRDIEHAPLALLFSVACHPTTTNNHLISAEYPGVAMTRLNQALGCAGSIFLQGVGADTKPAVVGDGESWRTGDWADVAAAGAQVAEEVLTVVRDGLSAVTPALHSALLEVTWPLQSIPDRGYFASICDDPAADALRREWAGCLLERMDAGQWVPESASLLLHGVQLGEGLRMVALEAEPVAGLGMVIERHYADGVTFPLGFTNGVQLYLPTSRMLSEGGYEVESYFEYGYPAPLAAGIEDILHDALIELQRRGIS
jgi:hypothetical protein